MTEYSYDLPKQQGWYWFRWLGHSASRPEPLRLIRHPREGDLRCRYEGRMRKAAELDGDWRPVRIPEPDQTDQQP